MQETVFSFSGDIQPALVTIIQLAIGVIIGLAIRRGIVVAWRKFMAWRAKRSDGASCVWNRLRPGPNGFTKCSRCGMPEIDHVDPLAKFDGVEHVSR